MIKKTKKMVMLAYSRMMRRHINKVQEEGWDKGIYAHPFRILFGRVQ